MFFSEDLECQYGVLQGLFSLSCLSRAYVLEGQRMLDPDGVEMKKRHQLKRRVYSSKGPNFSVHVDQYDKLRAYGFCVHGAIDG